MSVQLIDSGGARLRTPPTAEPEEALEVELVEGPEVPVNEHSVLGLAEMLLKQPVRVDWLTRADDRQRELIPRFLAIALLSFSVFAVCLSFLLTSVRSEALPTFLAERWSQAPLASAVSLTLAYTLGLIAATGVCLPCFYFYGLLAGVKVSLLGVTTHIMKGKSATSIMLLGILPIYVAFVLGMIVFDARLPELKAALYLGLVLPFVAGLWGTRSLYRGFLSLADTLPAERRCERTCFLRRLTFSCAACYSAVTPVMIYTLWDFFAGKLV